jgi:hypothetical protein
VVLEPGQNIARQERAMGAGLDQVQGAWAGWRRRGGFQPRGKLRGQQLPK